MGLRKKHYFPVKFVLFYSHKAITFFVTFVIFLIRITLKTMVKLLNHIFLKPFIVILK